MTYEIDTTGILFATFSLLSTFLLIPPLLYHCLNKNIPAISLIAWFIYKNVVCFINALIWSGDNFDEVTQAPGYCDLTVRLTSAADLGQLCATACLMFNLYMVISARSYKFLNAESRTKKVVNIVMCWFNPVVIMGISVLAQGRRYAILRYRGCTPLYNFGVKSILMSSLWNAVWVFIAFVFAILTLIEYIRKRKDFKDLLKCSNTGLNARKFTRLIIFSLLIIFVLSPVVLFGFVLDLENAGVPQEYLVNIGDPLWSKVVYIDAGTLVIVQRCLEIALSFCAFGLFGLGSEALKMYRRLFINLGLVEIKEPTFGPETEFQGFKKKEDTASSSDDQFESEKWHSSAAFEHIIDSSTKDDLIDELTPTVHMVAVRNNGSKIGLKGLDAYNLV